MPSARPTTVRDLRRTNRSRTLWELYLHGPLTYQGIARAAHVSLATVSNVMCDLLRIGCVAEVGSEESNGGRPRGLFHIDPRSGHVIGVDVSETTVRVELFDLGMHVLASHRSRTSNVRLGPDEVIDHVISGIDAVMAESGVEADEILGVGVGVPGLVEREDEGAVVYDQSIGWGALPIERMLRERTDLPLVVDNGANTLGQAERWFGAAAQSENAIIVLLGAGVGASIVATPGTDARSFAGELGHTTVVAGGRDCVCGANGCLEAYAGADAIVARYDYLTGRERAANPREVEERLVGILGGAARGSVTDSTDGSTCDPAAVEVVGELVDYLGVGLGNLVNLFTPEKIVIGGWLGHALPDQVLPLIREAIGRNALARPFQRLEVVRADLGRDAVALGAATLPVAEFLRSGGVARRASIAASA
ncbi:ROK family protein [Planctomonas sp. JC2975]|uniref:ROK family protein n=1 Tax=Planctomonas sp. JC2975 TaxID=2729626 RepID=UPI001472F4FB|nr:ROK family protein [Planctomonas sp. JC2975]NNC12445.1 ROK family protein [Planctomonas sp. JC2975]